MTGLRPAPGSAAPAPATGPASAGPLIIPGHRLEPSPERDRRLRRGTTVVGALLVAAVVLSLVGVSVVVRLTGGSLSPVPAVTALGRPGSLTLAVGNADLRVLPSAEVEELTLALVAPGSTELPPAGERVPARISLTRADGAVTAEVVQPARPFGVPWDDPTREVLLLVPGQLDLAVELRVDVGDIGVDGEFTALDVHSSSGDLRLGPLSAEGGVSASTDVGDIGLELGSPAPDAVELTTGSGDIDLHLPTDASGQVEVMTGTGEIEIAVPGTARWDVRASSDLGEVRTAPGLSSGEDDVVGTLTVTSAAGDVDITR